MSKDGSGCMTAIAALGVIAAVYAAALAGATFVVVVVLKWTGVL